MQKLCSVVLILFSFTAVAQSSWRDIDAKIWQMKEQIKEKEQQCKDGLLEDDNCAAKIAEIKAGWEQMVATRAAQLEKQVDRMNHTTDMMVWGR